MGSMHLFLFLLGLSPTPDGTPVTYQLWSGLVPSLVVFGAIIGYLRSRNCHVHGCLRLARHDMAGGQFRVCRRHSHHPDRLTHFYIQKRHAEHEERHGLRG